MVKGSMPIRSAAAAGNFHKLLSADEHRGWPDDGGKFLLRDQLTMGGWKLVDPTLGHLEGDGCAREDLVTVHPEYLALYVEDARTRVAKTKMGKNKVQHPVLCHETYVDVGHRDGVLAKAENDSSEPDRGANTRIGNERVYSAWSSFPTAEKGLGNFEWLARRRHLRKHRL